MIDNFLCARVWGRFFQVQLAEQLHQVAREREREKEIINIEKTIAFLVMRGII